MNTSQKLQAENAACPFIGLLIGIFLSIIFVVVAACYSERTMDTVVGSLLAPGAIFSTLIWYRTKNNGYEKDTYISLFDRPSQAF